MKMNQSRSHWVSKIANKLGIPLFAILVSLQWMACAAPNTKDVLVDVDTVQQALEKQWHEDQISTWVVVKLSPEGDMSQRLFLGKKPSEDIIQNINRMLTEVSPLKLKSTEPVYLRINFGYCQSITITATTHSPLAFAFQHQPEEEGVTTKFPSETDEIKNTILNHWEPGEGAKTQGILNEAFIVVNRDGQILKSCLIDPSTNAEENQAALKALQTTSEIIPLPSDFEGKRANLFVPFSLKEKNRLAELYRDVLDSSVNKTKETDFRPYVRNLELKIRHNWHPPEDYKTKTVDVFMVIDRKGNLVSSKITKSSGFKASDKAALAALKASSPFLPLPKSYKDRSVNVDFTFDYKLSEKKKSKP